MHEPFRPFDEPEPEIALGNREVVPQEKEIFAKSRPNVACNGTECRACQGFVLNGSWGYFAGSAA